MITASLRIQTDGVELRYTEVYTTPIVIQTEVELRYLRRSRIEYDKILVFWPRTVNKVTYKTRKFSERPKSTKSTIASFVTEILHAIIELGAFRRRKHHKFSQRDAFNIRNLSFFQNRPYWRTHWKKEEEIIRNI